MVWAKTLQPIGNRYAVISGEFGTKLFLDDGIRFIFFGFQSLLDLHASVCFMFFNVRCPCERFVEYVE